MSKDWVIIIDMKKICKSCLIEKPTSEFYGNKKCGKNYLQPSCKMCANRQRSGRYKKHPNKRHRTDTTIPWKNTPAGKEYIRKYRQQYRQRMKKDIGAKLRANVSRTIARSLIQHGTSKKGSSFLQCVSWTISDLKTHLEKQFEHWMTWDNYGLYNATDWNDNDASTWRWNLDHIIPQSITPYITMRDENFAKCWDLANLRPLSAKQNFLDGVRRARHAEVSLDKV